jgi:hypothetical protein
MLATVAGAALLAGATAANAQYYYDDGSYYGHRGPFVERGVGLQIGPVGIGVYDNTPSYGYDNTPSYGYGYGHPYRDRTRTNSTDESTAYRSQSWFPQSPPGGGY